MLASTLVTRITFARYELPLCVSFGAGAKRKHDGISAFETGNFPDKNQAFPGFRSQAMVRYSYPNSGKEKGGSEPGGSLTMKPNPIHRYGSKDFSCPEHLKCMEYSATHYWRFWTCSKCPYCSKREPEHESSNAHDGQFLGFDAERNPR
jgi:hypothetical protein